VQYFTQQTPLVFGVPYAHLTFPCVSISKC
jgi:hypothetical protein